MQVWGTIFYTVGFLSLASLVGFATTWIVGFFIRKKGPKKVGLIGGAVSLAFLIIGFTGGISLSTIYNKQQEKIAKAEKAEQKRMNKKYSDITDSFIANAGMLVITGEEVTKNIHSGWGDAIDNSGDDYDVNGVVTNLVSENDDDISTMIDFLSDMEKQLDRIDEYDTGYYEYDSDFYQKMYKHAEDYSDFVEAPSGSYLDYVDTANELHEKIADDLEDLS